MRNVAQLFENYLRSQGLRLTKQRGEILRVMYATHRHVSADELYEMLREGAGKELKISRATVYRTLALLEEGGFIQGLDIGRDSGRLYEHVMGHDHHDHMVCLACGRIIEFHDDELEAVQQRAVERHGFRAENHRLNVYGTCATCIASGESGSAESSASAGEGAGPEGG